MKTFVVALPLFNKGMAVEAYRLHYQNGKKLFGTAQNYTALDGAMNSPGLDLLNKIGIEPFTGGLSIFININKFMLMADASAACKIPFEKVVWVISKDVCDDSANIAYCAALQQKGFRLAIEDVPYKVEYQAFFQLTNYLIIDAGDQARMDEIKYLRYNSPNAGVVVKNIATKKKFEALKNMSDTMFAGKFYNEPITQGLREISPIKTNLLHLLKLTGDEDFELEEVAKIVQRDPSLSISLLRFINSPAVDVSSKISSIQNAIAFLGQKEVRKWISIAVSTQLAGDKPNEIIKLSLIRARFAEKLATAFELGIHAPALFLMGLFSLLDVVLEMPMKEAVKEISVGEQVSLALVEKKGPLAQVLNLIRAYERAEWENVTYIMVMNNVNVEDVNNASIDALLWYKSLLEEIE